MQKHDAQNVHCTDGVYYGKSIQNTHMFVGVLRQNELLEAAFELQAACEFNTFYVGGEWISDLDDIEDWSNPSNCSGDCGTCPRNGAPKWMEPPSPQEANLALVSGCSAL